MVDTCTAYSTGLHRFDIPATTQRWLLYGPRSSKIQSIWIRERLLTTGLSMNYEGVPRVGILEGWLA